MKGHTTWVNGSSRCRDCEALGFRWIGHGVYVPFFCSQCVIISSLIEPKLVGSVWKGKYSSSSLQQKGTLQGSLREGMAVYRVKTWKINGGNPCFHWFCFRQVENDQEHATSWRFNYYNETSLFMYLRIKFGVERGFSESWETRLKTFWLAFKETNVWMHSESGSFCKMWYIYYAPISLSSIVFVRSF